MAGLDRGSEVDCATRKEKVGFLTDTRVFFEYRMGVEGQVGE